MSADPQPQADRPQPTRSRGSAWRLGRIDIVAFVAGVLFILFSVSSVTVGVLDLPDVGAAPLWLVLIGAGVLLLVSELRGRKGDPPDSTRSSGAAEQAAWEQDPYR